MRFCPKCRTFFDDSLLRFCNNDGTPLLGIDQSSKIWSEGTEFIRQTNNTIQREIRRSVIKKVVSILVTTVVITSVISVITLRSWMYLNPDEVAKIRGQEKEEIETPQIIVAKTPDNIPVNTESTELTLTPIFEPTPKTDKPIDKTEVTVNQKRDDTSENTEQNTNKTKTKEKNNNANVNINVSVNIVCSIVDQQRFADEIKRSYASFWKQKILSQRSVLFEKYLKDQKLRNGAELSVYQAAITVKVDSKCQTATATIPIAWTVYSTNQALIEKQTINGNENFTCKKGKIWTCS